MANHRSRIAQVLGVLAVVSFSGRAADLIDNRSPVTVKLAVSASETIRTPVETCLARELRSLDNVHLVEDKPDWEITVLALDVTSTRGYRGGIAVSTVFLPRFPNEELGPLFLPDSVQTGLTKTSNLWERPIHNLQMDASDRLQRICRQIVSDFRVTSYRRNQDSSRSTAGPAESRGGTK